MCCVNVLIIQRLCVSPAESSILKKIAQVLIYVKQKHKNNVED
jgi:hypothetical protein